MIPADYVERCYAGWLGKVIGVRFGAPIEGMTYQDILQKYGEITGYLADYRNFAADDDTNGPLFFLHTLEDADSPVDVSDAAYGENWLNYIPYEHGMLWWGGYGVSTEHTAYLNLAAGIDAPQSGAMLQNGKGVSEQIGGQIFSDPWGLISPGNIPQAVRLANQAARVSHDGEAVHGSSFVAAAIADAFVCHDIMKILEHALGVLPQDSEYVRMGRDILHFYILHQDDSWRSAMSHIIEEWGYDRYPGNCHVIPNSAVMIMSLLYGGGDFDKTILICNMAGWDTDCNVGNVGTIVGVLNGLAGIADRWKAPINDFLVASSCIGCMNITTLPDYVRRLIRLGYRLASEPVLERWIDFAAGTHQLDFSLPGSTCAIRLDDTEANSEDHLENIQFSNEKEQAALCIHLKHFVGIRYASYGTYYHPEDFSDSRYDPAFSPVVYPGASLRAHLRNISASPIAVCLYCYDEYTEKEICGEEQVLLADTDYELSLKIPAIRGGRISRIGVRFENKTMTSQECRVLLYWLDWDHCADYAIDFANERVEQWSPTLHREVTQLTRYKGLWEIWDGLLYGSCADYAEAYTGDIDWSDAEIACRWQRINHQGMAGFGFRIQGGVRGYLLLCDQNYLYLYKKNRFGLEEMGKIPFAVKDRYELTVRCVADRIDVYEHDKLLLSVCDNTYTHGMTGFAVRDGARAAFQSLCVCAKDSERQKL